MHAENRCAPTQSTDKWHAGIALPRLVIGGPQHGQPVGASPRRGRCVMHCASLPTQDHCGKSRKPVCTYMQKCIVRYALCPMPADHACRPGRDHGGLTMAPYKALDRRSGITTPLRPFSTAGDVLAAGTAARRPLPPEPRKLSTGLGFEWPRTNCRHRAALDINCSRPAIARYRLDCLATLRQTRTSRLCLFGMPHTASPESPVTSPTLRSPRRQLRPGAELFGASGLGVSFRHPMVVTVRFAVSR
jgi:hypothetical protein